MEAKFKARLDPVPPPPPTASLDGTTLQICLPGAIPESQTLSNVVVRISCCSFSLFDSPYSWGKRFVESLAGKNFGNSSTWFRVRHPFL